MTQFQGTFRYDPCCRLPMAMTSNPLIVITLASRDVIINNQTVSSSIKMAVCWTRGIVKSRCMGEYPFQS